MNKPVVGIRSMQRIRNYGSFLQAYGLKRLLESFDCDVRFIDYRPGPILVDENQLSVSRPVTKLVEILSDPGPLTAKLAYANYKRRYDSRVWPLLNLTGDLDYETDGLDMLVIGSDEVFNCLQTNPNVGYSSDLFGADCRARRLITYAASCGNTTVEKMCEYDVSNEIAQWLLRFDALSARDENTVQVIRNLTGREPICNLDPVLAWDFFNKERLPKNPVKGRYLIAYAYSGRLTSEECVALRKFANSHDLKIVNVGGVQGCCDEFLDLNPFEVLAAFRDAECVLTDTFHGTILSVIAERPFATIVRTQGYGNSEKLLDLLIRLNLTNRVVKRVDEIAPMLMQAPDWAPVRAAIEKGRVASRMYLAEQIALITETR